METIYMVSGSSYYSYHKGELVKTTPSGQKTVRIKRTNSDDLILRFTPNGDEIGGSRYSGHRIITEEHYNRAMEQRAREKATVDVYKQVVGLEKQFYNSGRCCDKKALLQLAQHLVASIEAL